jgi:hypothetical protein
MPCGHRASGVEGKRIIRTNRSYEWFASELKLKHTKSGQGEVSDREREELPLSMAHASGLAFT